MWRTCPTGTTGPASRSPRSAPRRGQGPRCGDGPPCRPAIGLGGPCLPVGQSVRELGRGRSSPTRTLTTGSPFGWSLVVCWSRVPPAGQHGGLFVFGPRQWGVRPHFGRWAAPEVTSPRRAKPIGFSPGATYPVCMAYPSRSLFGSSFLSEVSLVQHIVLLWLNTRTQCRLDVVYEA